MELKIGGNGLQSSQVAWLARARLKGSGGARRWCARSTRFCKVVRARIGGSACDPVDLKHLLILYGRKDAPCADHSTTAFVGRGVTGQWRMRLAYAYGTCADAHAARRAAARHTAARGAPSLVAPPLVAPPLSRRALLSPLAPSPCVPRRPPPSSCCCTNPAHGLKNHWASAMGE